MRHCLTSLICLLTLAPALQAQDAPGAVVKERLTWELTPYRIELCVIVEPSARLTSQLETQLAAQLTASAQAAQDGLWQVSSNQKHAAARSRLLRELPSADPPAAIETEQGIDKVIFVTVREQAGQFQITAREWDALTRLWNIPVKGETVQVGRIGAEALGAVQEAFGPIGRIEDYDAKSGLATVRYRGGALPRRDGSYLTPDRRMVYRPVIVETDKVGNPQPAKSVVIPWCYLTAPNSPAASTAGKSTTRLVLHRLLEANAVPEHHPLQLRLVVGLARSSEPIRIQVVDAESPHAPLAGYRIKNRELGAPPTDKSNSPGATDREGRISFAATSATMVEVMSGDEVLDARPIIPGLQTEMQIEVKSDRRRLQLAAALDELHDDLLDLEIRLSVLGVRVQQTVQARDLAGTARLLQEIRTLAQNPRYFLRLAELEKQIAASDEATRARLQPSLAKAQDVLGKLKAGLEKANQPPEPAENPKTATASPEPSAVSPSAP